MEKLTRTMLGAVLLAGSSTAVLAAGPGWTSPDTSRPAASHPGTAQYQPNQQQQPQNQPTTTQNTDSRNAGARSPSPPSSTQTASTGMQSSTAPQPSWGQSRAGHRTASTDPTGDRMTAALNLLSANGYTSIESLKPQGDQIAATAMVNGRTVSVLIDPQTHQITKQG